jgi:hypothetical protein
MATREIDRRRFLKWAVVLAVCSVPVRALEAQETAYRVTTSRPNILIILADDLGYGDVQSYNPQRGKIPTPNMDCLASEGMRFMDAHSSSGVCSPSRYALLTGRYHWRTRLQQGIVGVWGTPLIAPTKVLHRLRRPGRRRRASLHDRHRRTPHCVARGLLSADPRRADDARLR